MIEAVNAVISNATFLRGNAEQVSVARSFTADALAVETVARVPLAPYISPYVSVDTRFDTAVLQLRDSETGDVVQQFPTEPTLRARESQPVFEALPTTFGENNTLKALSSPIPEGLSVLGGSDITVVQEAHSAPSSAVSQGAGAAQAAIAALSIGAQAGQVTPTTVSVTA